jgi:hypothetical protein
MAGHIYLVQLREFINKNEQVYKIGRSRHLCDRFREYPKGSQLLLAMYTTNDVIHLKELKKKFATKFMCRPDLGQGYFEGSSSGMTHTIQEYLCEKDSEEYEDGNEHPL